MTENGNGTKASMPYTKSYDPNEISPLRISGKDQHNPNSDDDRHSMEKDVEISSIKSGKSSLKMKKNRCKGALESLLTRWNISREARLPFLLVTTICILLLIVLIGLIAFWPRIPYYMKADVCVEKECLEASAQILLWANISTDSCQDPYQWACGRFENEYLNHEFYGVNGGEWNIRTFEDYEDIAKIHSFVAKLSSAALTSSAQLMLKGLHQACMGIEMLDKSESDSAMKKAIHNLFGWIYGENYDPHVWDFKQSLIKVQSQYGISPFFKISIENRNSPPFGNIITISEGEVGLPHKMFYNLDLNHKIITGYKMLMRDFAINMGVVSEQAKKFAEQMYHFEKRIVTVIKSESPPSVIMSLKDVHNVAPSLPIFDTITTTFSNTKITEDTMVLVHDVETLRQMSIIVSTTDESPLNSFITWSLSRRYLPFMSREYRAALEEFESVLYGYKSTPPSWYFCSKLLKDWVRFALDALRQNPQLIVADKHITYTTVCKCITYENHQSNTSHVDFVRIKEDEIVKVYSTTSKTQKSNLITYDDPQKLASKLVSDPINYDHQLLKLIFYHLRNQFKKSIDDNVSIDQPTTDYINSKLSSIKLQIGIPKEAIKTDAYLNRYYSEFYWRKLHFIDNLESHWSFRKTKLENRLKSTNQTDKIISHLFPVTNNEERKRIHNSIDLNMIIVTEQALSKPYFSYKYPISINFARIGTELSMALLEATQLFGEQYTEHAQLSRPQNATKLQKFSLGDTSCIESKITDDSIPDDVISNIKTEILSGAFTAKAFKDFLNIVRNDQPIMAAELPDRLTYSALGLKNQYRQVGLRKFDENQLFTLAYMQRHCSVSHSNYKLFKPFIENEISQQKKFDIAWEFIQSLPKTLDCSVKSKKCDDIL